MQSHGRPVNSSAQIWLFSLDVLFSSSVRPESRQDPTRAMKVLWKDSEEVKAPLPGGTLDAASNAISAADLLPASCMAEQQPPQQEKGLGKPEGTPRQDPQDRSRRPGLSMALPPSAIREEILLLPAAFSELRTALEHSADYLPEAGREFDSWRVGLLERFRESECLS